MVLFSPFRLSEATGLQEREGDHAHERVLVQARPRSALEVIEAEFLFELLMRLFTRPARFDGRGQALRASNKTQGNANANLAPVSTADA